MDLDADDLERADSERAFRFVCVLRGVVAVTAAAGRLTNLEALITWCLVYFTDIT